MINKKIILLGLVGILIGLVINSCAHFGPNPKDSDLMVDAKEFVKDSKGLFKEKHLNRLKIYFLTLREEDGDGIIVGKCYPHLGLVEIDPRTWYFSSKIVAKAILYHELSHCLCYNGHEDKAVRKDGCPVSLMEPSAPSTSCLLIHWEDYKKKLFKDCE